MPAMSARWNGLSENAGWAGLRDRVDFEREFAGLRFVVLRLVLLLAAGFFAGVFFARKTQFQ